MLTHNYSDGADEIQLVSGSNYDYPMTNNTLLTGFLFRPIFIVGLLTSKDFTATIFTFGEKAITKPQKLKRQSIY